jgi:hypothetical protein
LKWEVHRSSGDDFAPAQTGAGDDLLGWGGLAPMVGLQVEVVTALKGVPAEL